MLTCLLLSLLTAVDTLTVTLAGDLLLDRGVRRVIEHRGVDHLFSPSVDAVFTTSHVVVANLECPATKIRQPNFKRFVFRAESEWLPVLKHHGITHLNLANNHSIDQGRDGLTDTRSNILAAGMTPVGGGANMAEASRPVLLASAPRRVWLLTSLRLSLENFSYLPDRPCVSQEPLDSIINKVKQLKAHDSTCYVIVQLHWGGEHTLKPVPQQRHEAHQLIDAGADALVCHHTHTLQSVEHYRGKPVYYSIGNFIFDQHRPLNVRVCLVRISITATDARTETLPIIIEGCVPRLE